MTEGQEQTPAYKGPSKAAQQAAAEEQQKAAKAAEGMAGQPVKPMEGAHKYRVFVSPQQKDTSFLVKPGTLVSFRDPNSPTGTRDVRRDGDIWAVFTGGYLVTSDSLVIAWAEAHPDICRDARDPRTAAWAALKERQMPAGNREALIEPSMDIDGIVFGDRSEALGTFAPQKSRVLSDALAAADEKEERERE